MGILEVLLAIVICAAAFTLMIFLYARISRLFKKKSHHYIVPPEPEEDKNWHPVDFSKYDCFVFINNSSDEYIIDKLDALVEDDNEDSNFSSSDIEITKEKEWILLKANNLSFYDFKHFVWWLDDYSENFTTPNDVIGYCKHNRISMQDYLFKVDDDLDEENLIGAFRTGKNFGVYLPNSDLNEKGNISLSRNHELNFYSEESELPLDLMEKKKVQIKEFLTYYQQQQQS